MYLYLCYIHIQLIIIDFGVGTMCCCEHPSQFDKDSTTRVGGDTGFMFDPDLSHPRPGMFSCLLTTNNSGSNDLTGTSNGST